MPPRRAIITVLTLLGLLHAYIGLRLLPAMDLSIGALALAIAALAVSTVLVPTSLVAQRMRNVPMADQLAWAGFMAMGLFSSMLVLTFLRDLAWFILSLFTTVSEELVQGSAKAVPLVALAVTLVGFINARRVASVVNVDVPIAGLPAALQGYTIVQISDIHVGPTIKRSYLDAIVDKVNRLSPDAIAVTGDLVDGSVHRLSPHTAPLARLAARDGTYVVTGNHEYYSNAEEWVAELRRLGLTVLMNEHVLLERDGAAFMIAGVTDYTAHHFYESHRSDPHRAGAGAPKDLAVRILLAHQPRSAEAAADAGFGLQLSGHTHGGQFFPWNLFVPLQQPFTAGLNRLNDLWVYTSRGTGYWGPPKRFGAPSEITRLRLVSA
jgi:predicted MPP superfamily phosphohydrolase